MHLRIEFQSPREIVLPVQYNHILQGFIYKTIDEKLADFLHNRGYGQDRIFKLFSFSRLMGKYDNKSRSGHIIFAGSTYLEIASPMEDFCESFANGLFKKSLNIGGNELEVAGITIERQQVQSDSITLEVLSPVVVYSTLLKGDGSKYTCYFQPGEKEFERIAVENLRKKYEAVSGERLEEEVQIHCTGQPRLSVMEYKRTTIKGYTSKLVMNGSRRLIQTAVDAGLGSKNSQGFGCVRMGERSR